MLSFEMINLQKRLQLSGKHPVKHDCHNIEIVNAYSIYQRYHYYNFSFTFGVLLSFPRNRYNSNTYFHYSRLEHISLLTIR